MEDHNEIVSSIPQLIQPRHNKMLWEIPNAQEVQQALFSLLADKALGLDGFPMFFFQVYWEVVMMDVVKVVQEFFGAKNLLKELNSTFIVLILKVLMKDSTDQFRPISICNSFYNISIVDDLCP